MKVVSPQPLLKSLPKLFEAKQEPVRDGAKNLTVHVSFSLVPVNSLLPAKCQSKFCHVLLPSSRPLHDCHFAVAVLTAMLSCLRYLHRLSCVAGLAPSLYRTHCWTRCQTVCARTSKSCWRIYQPHARDQSASQGKSKPSKLCLEFQQVQLQPSLDHQPLLLLLRGMR